MSYYGSGDRRGGLWHYHLLSDHQRVRHVDTGLLVLSRSRPEEIHPLPLCEAWGIREVLHSDPNPAPNMAFLVPFSATHDTGYILHRIPV